MAKTRIRPVSRLTGAATALALAVMTVPIAQAVDGSSFISLGLGRSSFERNDLLNNRAGGGLFPHSLGISSDRSDRAASLALGYRWTLSPAVHLGLEAGYADLGESSSRAGVWDPYMGHDVTAYYKRKESVKAPLLGANLRWQIGRGFSLMAHGGIARYRSQYTVHETGEDNGVPFASPGEGHRQVHNGAYWGVALGYEVTPRFEVALAADRYRPEVGGEFRGQHYSQSITVNTWGLRVEYHR